MNNIHCPCFFTNKRGYYKDDMYNLILRKEKCYHSHITAPLGKSHDQSTGLPKGLNKDNFTFGVPTQLGMYISILNAFIVGLQFSQLLNIAS